MNDFPFALFGTFTFAYLAIILLVLIAQWKIFEKAGQPGWACIIPIYNFIVLMRVIGKPWWWLLLMLIPFVNIVLAIWTVNLLSKSFGKEEGFTIGLLLLPFIFYPILAFGDAVYKGPAGNNYVAMA
ncbi:MAG: hypothetical protein EKK39_13135 [Sphingobacteriales bacterium]|uniref:DUF5684 domain-containing protein n=1 Tax=Hydrotalea flava TaxID=714549 RepID=UPI00082E93A1|nr:DUF5684 domain-containing protein [Hydrotalea flava]RTL47990.1 MAG: hypothetical protein EKK39_13135 [Sphingobacteriales bacterium]